ncbi:3-isopropylmalate dehydratase large subunit [Candidatus Woesearchaeota archaeon]|nr:3-isopropylmalate dehydratase large subunit [Candidatus Woesearchaeota archaeon]|tara:strand:+ start:4037 stop:5434 length:1398 start_codon:yes stop_codon:yes gene_type:complete
MSGKNLLDKVWNLHTVRELPSGQTQLFVGLHLIHEVTSPQAFQMLREKGLKVAYPQNTFATADHIVPTDDQHRPFKDELAEGMMAALEKNVKEFNINYFDFKSNKQGIVHVIGPELGLTQPGMTIVCGDSHTSTHGAFGSIAFGIGTSQVRDVLATQCIAMQKPKARRINVVGKLRGGVYSKDVILTIIRKLGVNGGIGFAYEYAGKAIDNMSMEERMSICNMSIEGGARAGYINPDQKTFDYLKGKEFAPKDFNKAVNWWKSIASDEDADYDDIVEIDGSEIEPMVTWGINPGQAAGISENFPEINELPGDERETAKEAYEHTSYEPGTPVKGTEINVAFVGSCTNSRISDLREAAKIVSSKKVAKNIKAFVVPGSQQVKAAAEQEGLDKIFVNAGFQWRDAGCSMCLAMNPDKLQGREICASSSNRNFKGRQGSAAGRTILMSPAMVAAAAIEGKVADVRDYL